jgi:hexokinase
LPTTPWDNKLDRESINPRYQAFEKFISGMYLGEVARNVMLSLIDAAPMPILFKGKATKQFNQHYGIDTEILSHIELAWQSEGEPSGDDISGPELPHADRRVEGAPRNHQRPDDSVLYDFSKPLNAANVSRLTLHRLQNIRAILVTHLGYAPQDVSLRDAALVRWACSIVTRRAARLSGCAVAVVALQMGYVKGLGKDAVSVGTGRIPVGVDGRCVVTLGVHLERLDAHIHPGQLDPALSSFPAVLARVVTFPCGEGGRGADRYWNGEGWKRCGWYVLLFLFHIKSWDVV